MKNNNLYIIGNGFDIYHGIPSRYSDFREYLKSSNSTLHDHVIEHLPVDDKWSDLEVAFSLLDIDIIINEAMVHLQPYSAEDWSDSYHHDYQYHINQILENLSSVLKSYFCEWIAQLELPPPNNLPCDQLRINRKGLFLTFNYTRTLELVYDVGADNVLHIHGYSEQDESDIVLGHSWNPEEIPNLNDIPDPQDMDTRVMEGNELVNEYFGKTFKPSKKIIEDNAIFFTNLSSVNNIYVLGHSLSEVDHAYFEEVKESVSEDTEWVVSYYGQDELISHKKTIHNLGITNVSFCNLFDIKQKD